MSLGMERYGQRVTELAASLGVRYDSRVCGVGEAHTGGGATPTFSGRSRRSTGGSRRLHRAGCGIDRTRTSENDRICEPGTLAVRADQGDALPEEEQPVVAVSERPSEGAKGRVAGRGHGMTTELIDQEICR
jgi:hypothetical protein